MLSGIPEPESVIDTIMLLFFVYASIASCSFIFHSLNGIVELYLCPYLVAKLASALHLTLGISV